MSLFKTQVATAAKWSAIANLTRLLANYATLLVSAPFVSVEEFGLLSLILIVVNCGQILSEAGLRDALIYGGTLNRREFSSVFWICVLIALLVLLLLSSTAPALAALFKVPDLQGWIVVSAPIATILAAGAPHQAILEKELRFKALAVAEMTSCAVGLALTVAWLVIGSALAALVAGMLLRAAVRTAVVVGAGIPQWIPELRFSPGSVKLVGRFGMFRTADAVVGFLFQRLDRLLIAYFLGQEALGVYAFAWHIAIEPMQRLNPIFTQVLFPGLSKIKADLHRVAHVYARGLKLIASINLPIIVAVAVCAPAGVPLFFGRHWAVAVPLIGILSIVSATRLLTAPAGSLLMSQGRPDIALYWNSGASIFSGAIVGGAAAIGGLRDVAIVLAALYVLFFLIHPALLIRPVLPAVGFRQIFRSTTTPILLSAAAGFVAVAAGEVVPAGSGLKLLLQCVLGVFVYLTAFFVLDRAFVRETSALLLLGARPS